MQLEIQYLLSNAFWRQICTSFLFSNAVNFELLLISLICCAVSCLNLLIVNVYSNWNEFTMANPSMFLAAREAQEVVIYFS